MSIPSYVGSYDQLLNAVLGDPLLGSGISPHQLLIADQCRRANSDPGSRLVECVDRPSHWRLSAARYLASALDA
jgi:hypothetical protein